MGNTVSQDVDQTMHINDGSIKTNIDSCEESSKCNVNINIFPSLNKIGKLNRLIRNLEQSEKQKFYESEKFEFEQLNRKINELNGMIDGIVIDLNNFKEGKQEIIDYDKKIGDLVKENKLQDKTIKDLLPFFMVYYMSLQQESESKQESTITQSLQNVEPLITTEPSINVDDYD